MSRFDASLADRIKDRANLETIVTQSGVKLDRKGKRLVGLCPFHIEKTPTFAAIQASLDLNSRGGAQHLVNRLIERGWLVRTQSGALAASVGGAP